MAFVGTTSFLDFRKAIVAEVKRSLGIPCISLEPFDQDAPRPKLPYMAFKFTTPMTRQGFPAVTFDSGTSFNYGVQSTTVVSFNVYGETQEQAHYYMTLWNQVIQLETVRQRLLAEGLAVWDPGVVADLSALLNTGYEGRAQMDVTFGFAMNIADDVGLIEQASVTGTVDTNDGESTVVFDAPE
jgi:hypothetical protein